MSKKETKVVHLTSLKSLGGAAPVFDMPVKVERIDGTKAEIVFKVKGMKRTEWAAIRDEQIAAMIASAEEAIKAEEKSTILGRMEREVENAAQIISKAATGWSLDEDFTVENLKAMEDMIPGALQETLSAVDIALFQGRLGN